MRTGDVKSVRAPGFIYQLYSHLPNSGGMQNTRKFLSSIPLSSAHLSFLFSFCWSFSMWPRIFSLGFFPLSLSFLLSCSLLLVNILHLELQTGRVRAKFSCNLEEHSDSHKQNISSASRFHCVSTHSVFDLSLVRDTRLFHRVPIVNMDPVNILADMCSSLSWLNTEAWSSYETVKLANCTILHFLQFCTRPLFFHLLADDWCC